MNNELKRYLETPNMKYTAHEYGDDRWILNYHEPTPKGETLSIEVNVCPVNQEWINQGWIYRGKLGDEYISLNTFANDHHGNCMGDYNPQITTEEYYDSFERKNKFRSTTDFNWLFPANIRNLNRLLNEVERRAYGK